VGHVTCTGGLTHGYINLFGKLEGKRPVARWLACIRMDLREMGEEAWIGCIWLRTGTSGGLM